MSNLFLSDVILGNEFEGPLFAALETGEVTVTATSVPDADVALLVLTGIGILGLLERKKINSRIRF
jgi:hypothetical protein